MKKELEDILDSCLERWEHGVSLEEIVRSYPDHAKELRALLSVAGTLKKTSPPEPLHTDFRSVMERVRFEAKELKKDQHQKKSSLVIPFFFHGWMKAAAIILIVILIPWSGVSLSASSLPGDMLYPVKMAAEKVRYACSITTKNKAAYRIRLSGKRMNELVQFAGTKGDIHSELLESMLDEAESALDNISQIPVEERELYFSKVKTLSSRQTDVLDSLKKKVSSEKYDELNNAINACSCRMQRMDQMIKGERPQCQWGRGCCKE